MTRLDMDTPMVLIIGGGETFDSYDAYRKWLANVSIELERLRQRSRWSDTLQAQLGAEYDVLKASMPNTWNAQYDEWELWFSRILPLLDAPLILIGHSLGGIFLVKYLTERKLDARVLKTILIAPPFSDTSDYSLASFRLPSHIQETIENFVRRAGEIHIFHSTDDPVVPYADALMYKQLLPNATLHTLKDRGHFNNETFPELSRIIQVDSSAKNLLAH